MKKPLKKCLGTLFFAGLLAGAALAAEIGADPNRTPATPRSTESAPETTDPRTGLPPAPAEKMGPGIGSRGPHRQRRYHVEPRPDQAHRS